MRVIFMSTSHMKVDGGYVQVKKDGVNGKGKWGELEVEETGKGVRISLLVWSFCFYFSAPTKHFLMNKPQNYPNVCWRAVKTFAYMLEPVSKVKC